MSAPQTLQSEALQPSASTPAPAANPLRKYTPFVLFSILWLDLIRLLSSQWEAREQYAYGWFVPIFALALLWKRWQDRPSPGSSVSTDWRLPNLLALAAVGLAVAALLPTRLVYEINVDWPLAAWLFAGSTVLVSLYAAYVAGGWSWVRHFGFPICFILVAVAWPYRIEKGLTQGLMRVVAALTVEILGWLNVPAVQHGNLIELTTGTVGVDEACSGIRSFQSSLMAGLLMGELYRMRLHWRAVLVIAGLGIGFCLNVCRTLLLSWQASKEGLEAIDKWHDPAGMTITVLCFFCLWALALLLRKWTSLSRRSLHEGGSAAAASQLSTLNSQRFLVFVGLWSLVCILATEAWYRVPSSRPAGVFQWSAALPENEVSFETVELPPRTVQSLGYDLSTTGKWKEPDGTEWTAYFFRWNPRPIKSILELRVHKPESCLPASGFREVGQSELKLLDAGTLKLPFVIYTYQQDTTTIHVFFCQWEDSGEQTGSTGAKPLNRLHWVKERRRQIGQQTFEVICSGYKSRQDAETAFRNRLPDLVRQDPAPETKAAARAALAEISVR